MALPEYITSFQDDTLMPEDLTPKAMLDFARYCARTEKDMLIDVLRENIRVEMPSTSRGLEDDIFRSVFEDD